MRRFAHFALPLLGFLIALATGAWFSIERRAAAFSAGVDQRLAAAPNGTPAPASERERAFPSDAEMLTEIMSAVSEEEPLLRAHRLHDALNRLNSAELAVLFEKAVQVEDRDQRGALLQVLLTRWASIDPTVADAAVRPYRDRFRTTLRNDWRSLDTAVCVAWAGALPERALAEAMAAPNAQWARQMAQAAIQSLAEGDAVRQLEALTRLPASRLRAEMCETAIKALAEKDSAAAEARLDLFPDPRQRARVQSEILGKLAERDPAAGLARLAALAPDLMRNTDGMRLVNAVLRAAATKDAAAALAAVNGLAEELQTHALGSALAGWAGEHPIDALTWASANGVDLSETKAFVHFGDNGGVGWNSLLNVAFDSDRSKTLAWLRAQPASPERDSMLRDGIWSGTVEEKFQIFAELTPQGQADAAATVVQSSLRNGIEQIEPWVKALSAGAARKSAIQSLAMYYANNTPERIEALADEWPAGPDRDAALRGIVSSFSNNDPRRAMEFARRVSAPEARQSTFESIAQNWLYRDEPTARAWITSAPELSAEQKRVLLRQFDER
jgi:hypothetical protein